MNSIISSSYLLNLFSTFSTALLLACISGCATAPTSQSPNSPDNSTSEVENLSTLESKLTEQSNQFNKTVAGGAVVGAIALGVAAAIITGEAKYVTAGAAAGALVGGATGYYVAKKQEQYASESERIDAMVNNVNSDNEALRAYIVTVEKYVTASKNQIAQINQRYAAEEISRGDAKSRLESIIDNRQKIAVAIANLKHKKAEFMYAAEEQRKESGDDSIAMLSSQIVDLEQNIKNLENELDSLDSALQLSLV